VLLFEAYSFHHLTKCQAPPNPSTLSSSVKTVFTTFCPDLRLPRRLGLSRSLAPHTLRRYSLFINDIPFFSCD